MINPLVSVLMPAFNSAEYVSKAIQSIIDQSYTNWELLVCDDASTDDTRGIIDSYAAKDKRIIASHNDKNKKLLKTRNRLLLLCKGDLITFQDADDYSHPERLSIMVQQFLKKPNLGLLSNQIAYIDATGKVLGKSNRPTSYNSILEKIYSENVMGGSYMMIKKEVLKKVGGKFRNYFDGLSNQDYDLSFLIAQKFECYCLPDTLYYYRQHDSSASKNISVDRLLAKEVVIHLGKQRRDRGYDDIQTGNPEKVDEYFDILRKPYKEDKSLIYREYAANYMYNRMYRKAIITSFKSIQEGPVNIINWRTLFYCLRESFLKV